jgi:DnaD/phage-associated family protein
MIQDNKKLFAGFQEDNLTLVRLPESFFTSLLPHMDDINQLRTLLYLFWHNEQQQSDIRYFRFAELAADQALFEMLGSENALLDALNGLVEHGILLEAKAAVDEPPYYFFNGPQGRAAAAAIDAGVWQGSQSQNRSIHLTKDRPNIFQLYENNIGVITPMMAEMLKADEETYPASWIEDAIRLAVTRNARNWKYVQAILERWQNEGRGNEQNRRNDSQDPDSYRESWLGRK